MVTEKTNFPRESTMKEMANALNLIAIAQAGNASNIENWNSIVQIVRSGLGPQAFPVGSRLSVTHSEYGSIALDVAAHNHHKKPGDPDAPTMTLLMHHCIYGRQIDAKELLWANTGISALAAGTYNFTLYKGGNGGQTGEDGTYQFTTTKPIPAGGGWTHNKVGTWYSNAADYKPENITSGTVTTYDADGTVLESNLAVTEGSSGTALGTASNAKADCVNTIGTFNSIMRRAFGSNDSVAEGSVLPLYDGATQTDRIKYDQAAQTTARYWWLRSPYPRNASSVRIVNPSGALNSNSATDDRGLAAACVIY